MKKPNKNDFKLWMGDNGLISHESKDSYIAAMERYCEKLEKGFVSLHRSLISLSALDLFPSTNLDLTDIEPDFLDLINQTNE